jgi:hypothetical protein
VVPDDFTGYFASAGTAAGALIGLLFVAASLRPETVLGRGAPPAAQAMAGSAFTALINSFFVSLIALIPHTSLGFTAATMALISLYSTWRLHHQLSRHETELLQIVLALVAYLTQLGLGIALALHPHDDSLVYDVAYVLIGSFAVALRRAWSLMQGSHLPGDQESRAATRESGTLDQ